MLGPRSFRTLHDFPETSASCSGDSFPAPGSSRSITNFGISILPIAPPSWCDQLRVLRTDQLSAGSCAPATLSDLHLEINASRLTVPAPLMTSQAKHSRNPTGVRSG